MIPPAPQNTPFSAGIIVGLAFRVFTYWLLIMGPARFQWHNLPSTLISFLTAIYWPLVFLSPFWVPCTGSFLSAYFWRRLSKENSLLASRIIMAAVAGVLFVLSCFFQLVPFFLIGLVLVYVDDRMSVSGMKEGAQFWNERRPQLTSASSAPDGGILTRDANS